MLEPTREDVEKYCGVWFFPTTKGVDVVTPDNIGIYLKHSAFFEDYKRLEPMPKQAIDEWWEQQKPPERKPHYLDGKEDDYPWSLNPTDPPETKPTVFNHPDKILAGQQNFKEGDRVKVVSGVDKGYLGLEGMVYRERGQNYVEVNIYHGREIFEMVLHVNSLEAL